MRAFLFGAAEASQLEPLNSISDWLLTGPDIGHYKPLNRASNPREIIQYKL